MPNQALNIRLITEGHGRTGGGCGAERLPQDITG